ncbi:DUF6249 domain-containing protein [Winogradskyella alexanderae]|jgi:hypothetical protein|uniref:DUF6249 domain-containing protein n=1 Tax=Winogradskyella alexanderae TaxID=2877123 RepID=A0ABS7XPX4_9FLAO|nr:DUF6249 domain-containing protein [Winogradskyella alexanderae]MCA0132064.1 hypothetical protein [Winogradskyella alexanderae]
MDEEILIPISFFAAIFGMVYLYFSTRNKERLALIEKGADASIFNIGKKSGQSWKVVVLNLAFLLIGIGLGVFIAHILETFTALDEDSIYPAMIFLFAGIGLYIGFTQTKKALDD